MHSEVAAVLFDAQGLPGAAAPAAQGLQAALPATGFLAAQGFSPCAAGSGEPPAASATPMPTMSGSKVVDSSFLLSGSMTDRLLVFELTAREHEAPADLFTAPILTCC
jgi:hypothetical protein